MQLEENLAMNVRGATECATQGLPDVNAGGFVGNWFHHLPYLF